MLAVPLLPAMLTLSTSQPWKSATVAFARRASTTPHATWTGRDQCEVKQRVVKERVCAVMGHTFDVGRVHRLILPQLFQCTRKQAKDSRRRLTHTTRRQTDERKADTTCIDQLLVFTDLCQREGSRHLGDEANQRLVTHPTEPCLDDLDTLTRVRLAHPVVLQQRLDHHLRCNPHTIRLIRHVDRRHIVDLVLVAIHELLLTSTDGGVGLTVGGRGREGRGTVLEYGADGCDEVRVVVGLNEGGEVSGHLLLGQAMDMEPRGDLTVSVENGG